MLFSIFYQVIKFTVNIDGKLGSSSKIITDPRIFTDLRVLAGDDSRPAADGSYKNLFWQNNPNSPVVVSIINHIFHTGV